MNTVVIKWCLFVVIVVAVVPFYAGTTYPITTHTTTTTDLQHSLFYGEQTSGPVFTVAEPFLSVTYGECSKDLTVSDQTSCVMQLAEQTKLDADAFADTLITKARQYAKSTGESYFRDYEETLVQAKEQGEYVKNMCWLDVFSIYGGSGTNLEYAACEYYYHTLYFNLLKNVDRESALRFNN
jgi:hypothetical protein